MLSYSAQNVLAGSVLLGAVGGTLGAFALLAVLEPLPPASWARGATVTGAGAVLERAVHFYAQWLVIHERPHVKQIERIVSTLPR